MKLEKLAHFQSELTFLVKWSPGTSLVPSDNKPITFVNVDQVLNRHMTWLDHNEVTLRTEVVIWPFWQIFSK